MIVTGMDGWSRVNHNDKGYDIQDLLPLDLPAFDVVKDPLENWCKSWMGSDYSGPLELVGWFEEGH